jgi:CheY-like chemotaxis protein
MSTLPILVVEDDAGQLALFAIMLRHLPYRILTASDGQRALDILEEETPILIVLDIAMPQINGITILNAVRANPRFDATKILIVTASVTPIPPEKASRADKVLPKPVSKQQLLHVIGELLGQPG